MTSIGPIGREWHKRAISATRAHQSRLGCILLATLHLGRNKLPRFGKSAIVTVDGFVMSDFVTRDGKYCHAQLVGTIQEVIGNFRGLADHLKLSDAERKEMFTALRQWIVADYRQHSTLEVDIS